MCINFIITDVEQYHSCDFKDILRFGNKLLNFFNSEIILKTPHIQAQFVNTYFTKNNGLIYIDISYSNVWNKIILGPARDIWLKS